MARKPSPPPPKSGVLPGTPAGQPAKGPGIVPGTPDDARDVGTGKSSRTPRSCGGIRGVGETHSSLAMEDGLSTAAVVLLGVIALGSLAQAVFLVVLLR